MNTIVDSELNILGLIMSYEQGILCNDEIVYLFQQLIDSGLLWDLEGHYLRTAKYLLENGLIEVKKK